MRRAGVVRQGRRQHQHVWLHALGSPGLLGHQRRLLVSGSNIGGGSGRPLAWSAWPAVGWDRRAAACGLLLGCGWTVGGGLLAAGCAPAADDYYGLLGVDKSATGDQIRKAYKKQVCAGGRGRGQGGGLPLCCGRAPTHPPLAAGAGCEVPSRQAGRR